MTKFQKIWLAVGVGLAVVLIVALWRAGIACSTPRIRSALKIGDAAGCYEFWFNRYQSALGGVLAVIGAFIAGKYALRAATIASEPVRTQLKISERQTALQAIPILKEMIIAEVEEEGLRKKIEDALVSFRREAAVIEQAEVDEIAPRMSFDRPRQDMSTAVSLYLRHVNANPRGDGPDAKRTHVGSLGRAMTQLGGDFAKFAAEIARKKPTASDLEQILFNLVHILLP